jgi:protein phosphatase
VKVDLTHQPVRRGDTLILCSDGLSGLVRREEFAELAQQHRDPQALCAALIDLANERGGPDNITVITARFEGEGLPEAAGEDGVGYQSYRISAPNNQQDSDNPADASTPPRDAGTIALDRLRNLGLIMLLVGVVMLLIAVWR